MVSTSAGRENRVAYRVFTTSSKVACDELVTRHFLYRLMLPLWKRMPSRQRTDCVAKLARRTLLTRGRYFSRLRKACRLPRSYHKLHVLRSEAKAIRDLSIFDHDGNPVPHLHGLVFTHVLDLLGIGDADILSDTTVLIENRALDHASIADA